MATATMIPAVPPESTGGYLEVVTHWLKRSHRSITALDHQPPWQGRSVGNTPSPLQTLLLWTQLPSQVRLWPGTSWEIPSEGTGPGGRETGIIHEDVQKPGGLCSALSNKQHGGHVCAPAVLEVGVRGYLIFTPFWDLPLPRGRGKSKETDSVKPDGNEIRNPGFLHWNH